MMVIVVAADEHPDLDDWVTDQATAEAVHLGVQLGRYQGREDTLPGDRPDNLCCHVFTTIRPT
jgi:hypothetical protein